MRVLITLGLELELKLLHRRPRRYKIITYYSLENISDIK